MAEAATVPLGDGWWVLDRALGLYRELGAKKGREVLLLRELKVSYPGFPEGAVLARETPDFVADPGLGGRKVGLELVEAYRGGKRRKGSLEREREGLEEEVLGLAEHIYYAEPGASPVYAYLTWSPLTSRRGPLPRTIGELAGAMARIVRDGAAAWANGGRLELGPPELEGTPLAGVLHGLSARSTGFVGQDGRDSAWGRSLSYAREAAGVEDLAPAIASKDRVHEACRKRCDEAWLVVALTGGPSSFDDALGEVLDHRFPSRFERVVMLCPGAGTDRRAVALRKA